MTNSFSTGCALRWKESLKTKKEADEEVKSKRQKVESHSDDCESISVAFLLGRLCHFKQADEDEQRFHLVALRETEIVGHADCPHDTGS